MYCVLVQNQSRQSALPAAETLVPDPSLLRRMRSMYSAHDAYRDSRDAESEFEGG